MVSKDYKNLTYRIVAWNSDSWHRPTYVVGCDSAAMHVRSFSKF